MTVDLAAGKPVHAHEGELFHFCSQGCRDKFAADPEHYLSGAHRRAAAEAPAGTVFTCPMHPEIEQVGPGSCPICGMALEPKGVPTGDEGPNPELIDFKHRFWIGAVLTIPLLILSMGPLVGIGFLRDMLGERPALWVELALGTPVILWAGWPFYAGYSLGRLAFLKTRL
jgi:Cu+-exporting ATPase